MSSFQIYNTRLTPVVEYGNPVIDQIGNEIQGYVDGDDFGSAVASNSDGTYVIVGAPAHDSLTGMVRVFNFDGTTWNQIGSDIKGSVALDKLGLLSQYPTTER